MILGRSWRWVRSCLLLAVLLSACSTDSCSCDGFEQRAFPPAKTDVTIPAVGQVRISPAGLDFVEQEVPYIIDQVLPGGLSFCIPRDTSGNPELCVASTCANGSPGCQVDLTLDDQTITPVPTDTLEIDIVIGDINERLNFDYDASLFTVNCYVQLFKKGSSESTPATVSGNVPIELFVDQASEFKEVGINAGDVTVNLEDVDFKIHGRGNVADTVTCEGASLVRGLFRDRIENEIQGALADAVSDIRRDQLCRHCGAGLDDCPNGATCAGDGICDYSATQCVPRTLGAEGRLNVGSLLGDFVREPNARVDVLAKAADIARVDDGVSVGLRAAAEPAAVSNCVPVDPTERPPIQTVPASPTLGSDMIPGGGSFMLGIGLHRSAVEQALWSIWSSGATCLEITDQDVMVLNSTAFSLLAPSMNDFALKGRSAVLAVVANNYPTVELGANTVTPNADSYDVTDPLIRIVWDDVDFHVFVYAQHRMLRLLTLRLDLDLPVAVVADGMGNLTPIIPSLEDAIVDIEPRRLELLTESASTIEDIVPTLLSLAGPQLAGAIPEAIELPEFLGFRIDLEQEGITSVDNDQFVAVLASLERTNSPVRAVLNTTIVGQTVSYDRVLDSGFVRPEVTLDMAALRHGAANGAAEHEYSWRVDGGLWSLPVRSDRIVVDDPRLAIIGQHEIEVRARLVGEPGSTDPTPAVTTVDIDWEPSAETAPVQLAAGEPQLVEKLHAEYNARPAVVKAETTRPPEPSISPTVSSSRRTQPAVATGCQTGVGAFSWGALLLFGLVAGRRRRRLFALLGVAVLSFGCKGGCKGEIRTNADEYCYGPDCAVDQDCAVDSDCTGLCPEGTGGICEQSRCACVTACEPGCDEDAFCCLGTGECVDISGLCTGEGTCDAGYEPGVVELMPNRESCELDDFMCDCVPLPPIDIGWHGKFTSIDSDGTLTVVATYNQEYGDLMLGRVADDGEIDWHWVDGVPTGEPVGDPGGPRGGVSEDGEDVGTHTSVAIADDGTVHVFYRDEDADVLKWGRAGFEGEAPTFESEVLDDTEGAGHFATSVVTGGTIHLVYAVPEVASGGSEVRHIILDGAGAGSPNTIVAEAAPADAGKSFPRHAGVFGDLSATDSGLFYVFWNGVTNRVGRMVFDGSAWEEPSYLAEGTGPWVAGAWEAGGRQHVVFQQTEGARYSRFGDVATSRVDDGMRAFADEYWVGTSGEDASIRLENGEVIVAHQDAFGRALVVASSADGSRWEEDRRAVDGAASGFWVDVTRRGTGWVVDSVIDRQATPQGYVRVTPLR